MDKINKLVKEYFSEDFVEEWMGNKEFQAKLKTVTKPPTKKRVASADDKPKKHSAYIRFCMEERSKLNKMYPDLPTKSITAKLGERWNKLKEEDPEYLAKHYDWTPKTAA